MLRPLMLALLGTSFTFLMTALGAATVFFFARKVCERAQGALLGFAAGVMMAASVWSLILPAIEQTEAEGRLPPFLPAAAGIVLGALTLFLLDELVRRRGGAAVRRARRARGGGNPRADAVASELCSRGDALRRGGGASSARGRTAGDVRLPRRLPSDDDTRRRAGVSAKNPA